MVNDNAVRFKKNYYIRVLNFSRSDSLNLAQSPLLGSDDLIDYLGLSSSYGRYCGPKKLRDDLPSFLPQLCGTSKLNEQVDPAW